MARSPETGVGCEVQREGEKSTVYIFRHIMCIFRRVSCACLCVARRQAGTQTGCDGRQVMRIAFPNAVNIVNFVRFVGVAG